MATLARTWTISQNNSCGDQTDIGEQTKEILFDLKTKMLAAGWTVTQSSDSATSGASDLWIDADDLINATGAHSWIVLRSPAGYALSGEFIYFGIDYRLSNDNYCYCASRGDADWTSLSTTTGPTASTTNVNPFTAGNSRSIVNASLADTKFHSAYSNVGDIIYYTSNSAVGRACWAMLMIKCADAEATDLYPVLNYVFGMDSTNANLDYGPFYSGNFANPAYTKGFHPTTGLGSANVYSGGGVLDSFGTAAFWANSAPSNTGDELTGKIPAVPIAFSCSYPAGASRIVGQLTDIFACQGYQKTAGTYWKAQNGDVAPGTGTITQGVVGGVWVPCSSAPDFT